VIGVINSTLSQDLRDKCNGMKTATVSYKRHRFPPPIIAHAVWLYPVSAELAPGALQRFVSIFSALRNLFVLPRSCRPWRNGKP